MATDVGFLLLIRNNHLFSAGILTMTSTTPTPNDWLPLDDALRRALSQVRPVTESESVMVSEALHRVASEDVVAPVDVPPADNSAMDGYALYSTDTCDALPLAVVATQLAGMPYHDTKLAKGQAIRIMTGALIPAGADCVVMQENASRTDDTVVINKAAMPGENIRRAGGDIARGAIVIHAGTQLTASHLVLLASMGIQTVRVYRKLRVGIIATGDELRAAGAPLTSGQIYESNRTGTRALLAAEPIDVTDYGIVADDIGILGEMFSTASRQEDLIISSGGVSVGEADFVKELVADQGDIAFWKIAIKPGKPFAFGSLGDAVFCGVPGNPVPGQEGFIFDENCQPVPEPSSEELVARAWIEQDGEPGFTEADALTAAMYIDSDTGLARLVTDKMPSSVFDVNVEETIDFQRKEHTGGVASFIPNGNTWSATFTDEAGRPFLVRISGSNTLADRYADT